MKRTVFHLMTLGAVAAMMTGCGKSPEKIVNDVYTNANTTTFGEIADYVLPDSIAPFTPEEKEQITSFAIAAHAGGYASFTIDSVSVNEAETEAKFSVKTNFKSGESFTETGTLRKTGNERWRLMVDREATDTCDLYSVSDKTKMSPELMRNLYYSTTMTLATRGLPQYQVKAANILTKGVLTDQDCEQAEKLLLSAAGKNYIPAYYLLGKLYYKGGKGVERNYDKSFEWYSKGAEAGDTDCYPEVSYAYLDGYGVPKDANKAKEWAEKGVANGNYTSMFDLAYMYDPKGADGFEKNAEKAFELYNQGYNLALKAKDIEIAKQFANNIGAAYADGKGCEKSGEKAIEWYTKAAGYGYAFSMKNLGNIYYEGRYGIPKDYDKAYYWYSKGSKGGNIDAEVSVAECYEYGRGVAMNKRKAKEMYIDIRNRTSNRRADAGYDRTWMY